MVFNLIFAFFVAHAQLCYHVYHFFFCKHKEVKLQLMALSYVPLFLALIKRNGYRYEFSEPQLVNGSATPPPTKHYPGLVCYLVTFTVNGVEYHGYGPTVGQARRFAAFEAYKALRPLSNRKVTNASQSGYACEDNNPLSTIDEASVCSETVGSESDECMVNSSNWVAQEGNESNHHEEQNQINERGEGVVHSGGGGNEAIPERCASEGDKSAAAVLQDMPSKITHNPVGQLQELLLKEYQTLPVFAESIHVNGKNTEFVCTIEMKEFSARGKLRGRLRYGQKV